MRSRELVAFVAEASRLPAATVEQHYRRLHANGLMTTGGRGRSAPHMTDRDGMRLLLAAAISPSPAMGADLVPVYEAVRPIDGVAKGRYYGKQIGPDCRLGDALLHLMEVSRGAGSAEIASNDKDIELDIDAMTALLTVRQGYGGEKYMLHDVEVTSGGWFLGVTFGPAPEELPGFLIPDDDHDWKVRRQMYIPEKCFCKMANALVGN